MGSFEWPRTQPDSGRKGYAHPYLYCDDKVACAKKGDYKKFLKTNRVAESLAACEQARKDKLGIWADTSKLSHLR
jgi:endonuclease YncB( thermonuclease family)